MEWLETFRAELRTCCRASQRRVKTVDVRYTGGISPGELLLRDYVTHPTLAESYRRSIGYAKFLANNDQLSGLGDLCLLVQGASGEAMREWIRFIADYHKAHKPSDPLCRFILECAGEKPDTGLGVKVIDYHEKIRPSDTLIFTVLAASALPLPPLLQSYAAELAAMIGSSDPEIAAVLIEHGQTLIKDPLTAAAPLLEAAQRSDGSAFPPQTDLLKQIRRAQVKCFFPIVEQFRLDLIERFADKIPIHAGLTNTFGAPITDIWEIDLGTFKFLCDNAIMHIPYADYQALCFFRDCRNQLAHTDILSYEQIKKLAEH